MPHSVLIAAPNQTIGYELRAQVEELDDFTVVDVADKSDRLQELVIQRDPEIVLVHEDVGPLPVPQTIRELGARRPGTAILLVSEEMTPEVFSTAMDAGARGVLGYPVTHEDMLSRMRATAEWVVQMRRHLSSESGDSQLGSRGRLVAVAGSKGGVGTTTLAVHLAHDAVSRVAGRSVCLVDLDLDTGDLADFLGVTHRLDISDLAKVADDLSAQTVGAAVHRGTSGLASVLSPSHIEDIGEVGERETVLILAALRRHFDLVIVDCGASVNPATAAAVETADEVLLVTTPDLLALRGVHRIGDRWARVGAADIEKVRTVLNKVHRDNDIQPDTAARLLPAAPISTSMPDAPKTLQRGLNHQDPGQIQAKAWWSKVGELAEEVATVPATAVTTNRTQERSSLFRRRGEADEQAQALTPAEDGQASVEFAGLIGIIMLLMVILWQVALWGVSAAYTGHAADEAARRAGIGGISRSQLESYAERSVPSFFRQRMDVDILGAGQRVRVQAGLPVLVPGLTIDGLEFTSESPIIDEDN